jgi:hypothetical protein
VSLYCIGCGADHDFDVFPDTGECMICGDWLVSDDDDLPDPEVQIKELLEVAGKLEEVSGDFKKGVN